MLKALELIGFKSFADKTRFEFPPGVTVVVGPNGSGKSNIVDAIKWVLGAQSVKALRGKEMADVIFNGSGSRRPVNTAETTLTFDNSTGMLAVDTKDVHVTRRIYRSGEGEYLINHQPCRLRDIRDLFAGTGIATEAYSVIEQGKVDVMLQSSPKDRRLIFEEAAGISRFKAKKLEATRRLDRVDQNLLRLSDIVDEVESRLRMIRSQAGKARRYKEYTDRLQELRTQVAMADWRRLTSQIDSLENELSTLCESRDQAAARIEAIEAESLVIDTRLAMHEESIRATEAEIANNRQKIATAEATIEHERARVRELEVEADRHRSQLTSMRERTGDLAQQLRETAQALDEATERFETMSERFAVDERKLQELTDRQTQLRQTNQSNHESQVRLMQSAGRLESQISALESQQQAARATRERCEKQLAELEQRRADVAEELEISRENQEDLEQRFEERKRELESTQSKLREWRIDLKRRQKELSELQGRRTGAAQRKDVLEELERRLEGLSAGVKQVLAQAQESPGEGPYQDVRGLVADLLSVSVESAALVEVALGEHAQYLVVASGETLLDHLTDQETRLDGRVGFLRMDIRPPSSAVDRVNLDGQPGVLGRADRFVETAAEFRPLAERLLGRTWFVETLAHARELADGAGRGLSFVTLAGELLSAEGTITVGPKQSVTGLISRRSELRAIRQQLEKLALKVEQSEKRVEELEEQIGARESELENQVNEEKQVSEALSAQRLQTAAAEDRLEQWRRQLETLSTEADASATQLDSTDTQLADAREKLEIAQRELADVTEHIEADSEELDRIDAERMKHQQITTTTRIELATDQQRLDSLRREWEQMQRDRQERSQTLESARHHLDECVARQEQSSRATLAAQSQIAELYLEKEKLANAAVEQIDESEGYRSQRGEIMAEAQRLRRDLREVERQVHEKELAAGQFHHQRDTLAQRVQEDYELDIRQLAASQAADAASDEEIQQREDVETEISELRRKINNIGGVNLEALHELDDLETRYSSLSTQFEDLSKAKASLEQIIARINADSRKMFSATLDTARGHFQELFRKLFGGGQADIILEEGPDCDILDSGIEIVARPPGKEPRSISLLSGGEKTLTCVALLLSIFRSRPSPFCVLDEVDAALDEANIERFIGVITEFLSSTQFIVVTHSKKTMTAANTLYGVTMQESGVSKRVSVRFEDVSEDGHIDESAVAASLAEEEAAQKKQGEDDTQAA